MCVVVTVVRMCVLTRQRKPQYLLSSRADLPYDDDDEATAAGGGSSDGGDGSGLYRPCQELYLRQGDMLYLPRGTVHYAGTGTDTRVLVQKRAQVQRSPCSSLYTAATYPRHER